MGATLSHLLTPSKHYSLAPRGACQSPNPLWFFPPLSTCTCSYSSRSVFLLGKPLLIFQDLAHLKIVIVDLR